MNRKRAIKREVEGIDTMSTDLLSLLGQDPRQEVLHENTNRMRRGHTRHSKCYNQSRIVQQHQVALYTGYVCHITGRKDMEDDTEETTPSDEPGRLSVKPVDVDIKDYSTIARSIFETEPRVTRFTIDWA